MSLYQMSNPNLPNYESQFSIRDIDRVSVSTMNKVEYYDYDIAEKRLVSGPSDSRILAPVELDSGLPERLSDDDGLVGPYFISGSGETSLTERINSVNNGRVADIEVLDFNLPINSE